MRKPFGMAMVVFGVVLATVLAGAATPSAPATASSSQPTKELTLDLGDKVTLQLVLIPAGKFLMGSPETEKDRERDETQHEVTISKPYYMGVTHVTVDQFTAFAKDSGFRTDAEKAGNAVGFVIMDGKLYNKQIDGCSWRNPSFEQRGDHPVVQVSWNDAKAFCDWLSSKSGRNVSLPTEAQWEYACRAGTKTAYPWGDNPDEGKGRANGADQSLKQKWSNAFAAATFFGWDDGFIFTSPVGSFKANAFGLFDMNGNAWQWCQDRYGDYDKGAATNPTGVEVGPTRVIRGGCWNCGPGSCRAAYRNGCSPYYAFGGGGFRVVVAAGTD